MSKASNLNSSITIVINGKNKTLIWDSYKIKKGEISILDFIEKNSEQIKKKYIELVTKFGHVKIHDKELHEILNINKDFSFWWTTTIYEKSFYKQSSIHEVIKLIALRIFLVETKPVNLTLNTPSKKLKNSMLFWILAIEHEK